MNHASPLMRWKEIVHPLFWPFFFWNLRRFLAFMQELVAETGGNGLIDYEVTWWGRIRVYWHFRPDDAKWDDGLSHCRRRVRIATLDVLNPHLAAVPAIFAELRFPELDVEETMGLSFPGVWSTINAGSFAEPAHLNTS